jgi:RimJ/RimL family protein N-acetyltransferase
VIETDRCILRPYRADDRLAICRHANDRDVWRNMRDRFPHPYTERDAEEWIALASSTTPLTNFAIEVEGEAAGGIGMILHSDIERMSAEIGYWLGRQYWGRGIVTVAVRALSEWGFREFGLTRIYAVPFAHNIASCRVLEKAGYALEGVMKRSAIKEGVVVDQRLYAITDHMIASA